MEELLRSSPAWLLYVLQPKGVVSSAVRSCHLVLVADQQQWRYSLASSPGPGTFSYPWLLTAVLSTHGVPAFKLFAVFKVTECLISLWLIHIPLVLLGLLLCTPFPISRLPPHLHPHSTVPPFISHVIDDPAPTALRSYCQSSCIH